jgi:hypothetical protein
MNIVRNTYGNKTGVCCLIWNVGDVKSEEIICFWKQLLEKNAFHESDLCELLLSKKNIKKIRYIINDSYLASRIDRCLDEIRNGRNITLINDKLYRLYFHLVAKSIGYVSKTKKEYRSEDVCWKHGDTYDCKRRCRKNQLIYTEEKYVPICMDLNSRCMSQKKYVMEKLLNTCMCFPKEINAHIVSFLL